MPSLKDLQKQYAVDVALERDGAWVNFPNGMSFRIRSYNSHKVQDFLKTLGKKQRQTIVGNGGVTPSELEESNEVQTCARVLISEWRGITADDGTTPLPCTPKAIEALLTPEMAPLRRELLYLSRIDETFKTGQQDLEAMAENLGKSSTAPAD